jgi:flagellar motor switch/type III secretory pathway protein FliN
VLELERISSLLGELVGAVIEVQRSAGARPERERFAEVTLDFGGRNIGIGVAPELATALLARVLGRSLALEKQNQKIGGELAGALAALAVEVARRAAHEPVIVRDAPLPNSSPALGLTVRVDGKPYDACIVVPEEEATKADARPALADFSNVLVSLPVVVAVSLARRTELESLRPGSAWLPGEGAFVNARGVGRGALVAPNGERGTWVDLTSDGRVVLRNGTAELAPDAPVSGAGMAETNGDDTLTEAVLEAPVVVRVELGAVSMAAGEWAKLRPGDVIETGQRVAEPVVLRIAGSAVARGELVDVDGELGVRITELVGNAAPRR